MKMLDERFPVAESVDDSLRTANELINKYPNLKGFLCYGSQGPIGAGRAVQQKGLQDKIAVVGTYSPSQAQKLVESGAIKGGYTWNPMLAGRVFVQLAKIVMDGKPIADGMEIPKFGKVKVDAKDKVIFGDKLDDLGIPNIYELIKLGL